MGSYAIHDHYLKIVSRRKLSFKFEYFGTYNPIIMDTAVTQFQNFITKKFSLCILHFLLLNLIKNLDKLA